MATLQEIAAVWVDDNLRQKVKVALTIIALEVRDEDQGIADHVRRLSLANRILSSPEGYEDRFLKAMIADNKTATVSQIQNATDDSILSNVRSSWNVFLED